MSLRDLQSDMRDAIVLGRAGSLVGELRGGRDPVRRLAVHQRHYRASVARALLARFPATAWLLGGRAIGDAALEFVAVSPPGAPCLADYGDAFPAFLAGRIGDRLACLADFARLELCAGTVSLAISLPALAVDGLAGFAETSLPELCLDLQPGLRFLRCDWPVDDLFAIFVAGNAPERLRLDPAERHLEVRGARGALSIERLPAAEWRFRRALAGGAPIDAAAAAAGDGLDASAALGALFARGLVTAIRVRP